MTPMFAVFALLPLGLASWFSRRELARATAGIFPLPFAIGLGSSLVSQWFGGKAKKKKEEASNAATIGAAEIKNQMNEDTRTAHADVASSLLGSAGGSELGHSFALDPALVARLGVRRSYDFKKGVPKAGAGAGSAFLSGLFGTAADMAGQYSANKENEAAMEKLRGLSKTGSSDFGPSLAGNTYQPFTPAFDKIPGLDTPRFAPEGPSTLCPPGQIC